MDETLRERSEMPATAARIYDYMLGGTHNFPADQEAARQLMAQFPVVPLAVRANRATLASHGVAPGRDRGAPVPRHRLRHADAVQRA